MFVPLSKYNEIPAERAEKIDQMQVFVKKYFDRFPNRKPRNIHRIGLDVDKENFETKILMGYNNYKELSSIYNYILSNSCGSLDSDHTHLEYMLYLNNRGSNFTDHCSEKQHEAEMAVVAWLGTDVGMEFLKKSLNDSGYEISKKES